MNEKLKNSLSLQILVRVAVMAAMDVLLMNYLGIHTKFTKIGFAFVPIAVCGMLYGPKWSTLCAGLGDIINCLLGPYGWYPPLTVTACLNGFVFGIFLKGRSDKMPAIIAAVLVFQIFISLGLNTLILSHLYETPLRELLISRVPQTVIMTVVQIAVLRLIGTKRVVNTIAGSSVRVS